METLKSLATSMLISATLVVPFFALEWVNRRTLHGEFPTVLFTFMFVHSLLIVLLLSPPLRQLREARTLRSLTAGHWAGLLCGVLLSCAYVGVVGDQVPCFMGVPNCD